MYDLAIKRGCVITPDGKQQLDIGIRNGRIAGLSLPGMLGEAKDTLEVPGRYIFPGGIDVHVHMDDLGAVSYTHLDVYKRQGYGDGIQRGSA